MKYKKCWMWFILAVLLLPAPVFAAGNMHYGQLEIHPSVSLTETYNDNIFPLQSDRKADWITTITPGIKLALPYRRHLFTAEYNAVIDLHSKYSSEDTTDQNGRVLADFKIGSLFGLTVGDTYTKGHEPRATSASGQIEKFERNAPSISATYQLANRSKIQLDYTRARWNFQVNDFRTHDEDLTSAYFYYRFMPKTSAFVEYDWRNFSYDQKTNGLDSQAYIGWLGLTWEISERTRGTVKAGYHQKNFKDVSNRDYGTWGASVDVKHAFSDAASLYLIAMRDVNESRVANTYYYVTTGAYAEYTHKLTEKISAVARVSYGVDDYSNVIAPDTQTRSDKTFLGGAGLKYQMRDWVGFSLDYNYRNRNSNIPAYNLDLNTFSLTITFAL
jgi:hypothetical protein